MAISTGKTQLVIMQKPAGGVREGAGAPREAVPGGAPRAVPDPSAGRHG
ncbi:hypothetical protein [Planotetraspora phitsanulokensis]|nr:hypothetical protein [Planotetraspora phitsanulokensis]